MIGSVPTTLWTIDEVATHLGIEVKSADKQLRRWGVVAVTRQPGRGGKNLYDSAAVLAAAAAAPGQGARTDRKGASS